MLFPIVLTLSLLNVVVSSLILAVFVLYASHKIAGPMYRFKLALDEISRRNLSATTSVRHDDQLQEVSASLKRVAETLREDCQTMKDGLATMKPLAAGNASPELLRTLEKLQTTVDLYQI
jgi:nitrate/nitrite-specific signal transduction histidine kinase